MKTDSQNAKILKHLKKHGSITPLEALTKYGCFRLSARIYQLKSLGFSIKTEIIHNLKLNKRYAKYKYSR